MEHAASPPPRHGPNKALPPMRIMQSAPPRSAVAQLLLWVTILASVFFDFDLMPWLLESGFGESEEEVYFTLTQLWLGLLALWAWWERRAPNYRLQWPWEKD